MLLLRARTGNEANISGAGSAPTGGGPVGSSNTFGSYQQPTFDATTLASLESSQQVASRPINPAKGGEQQQQQPQQQPMTSFATTQSSLDYEAWNGPYNYPPAEQHQQVDHSGPTHQPSPATTTTTTSMANYGSSVLLNPPADHQHHPCVSSSSRPPAGVDVAPTRRPPPDTGLTHMAPIERSPTAIGYQSGQFGVSYESI